MAKVVKRTFSLTEEQAKFIDSKVELGAFASGSEVVRDGLRALEDRDARIEYWLRHEVVPVVERLKAGTEKTSTPAQVRRRLERRFKQLTKAAE